MNNFKKIFEIKVSLEDYTEAVKAFAQDTKEWYGLEDGFYLANSHEWHHSCDGGNGGLDVSWAYRQTPTDEEIQDMYVEGLKQDFEAYIENILT